MILLLLCDANVARSSAVNVAAAAPPGAAPTRATVIYYLFKTVRRPCPTLPLRRRGACRVCVYTASGFPQSRAHITTTTTTTTTLYGDGRARRYIIFYDTRGTGEYERTAAAASPTVNIILHARNEILYYTSLACHGGRGACRMTFFFPLLILLYNSRRFHYGKRLPPPPGRANKTRRRRAAETKAAPPFEHT